MTMIYLFSDIGGVHHYFYNFIEDRIYIHLYADSGNNIYVVIDEKNEYIGIKPFDYTLPDTLNYSTNSLSTNDTIKYYVNLVVNTIFESIL
jgi:hypothetical protein